jgi:YndJ-like protein
MVLARWGLQPLGFGVHTDLLTAVHFHFIALAALIITGLTGQMIQASQTTKHGISWRVYRLAALGVLVDPLLVAAGLTIAQVTGLHFLDTAPADLLALSLILISLLGLHFVVPTTTSRVAQVLLVLSYTTVFFTMLAAFAYALGGATGAWIITIPLRGP